MVATREPGRDQRLMLSHAHQSFTVYTKEIVHNRGIPVHDLRRVHKSGIPGAPAGDAEEFRKFLANLYLRTLLGERRTHAPMRLSLAGDTRQHFVVGEISA